MSGREWTSRKTPLGEVVPVTRVTGETTIFVLGGRALGGKAFGLTPAAAREAASALIAAADEVESAEVQETLL